MIKRIMVYVLLNVITFIHIALLGQNITMAEPFSNEGPAYVHLRIKQPEKSSPISIIGGSVSIEENGYNQQTVETMRSQQAVLSSMADGTHIQFKKSSELLSDLGSYGNASSVDALAEPESSVMMRGPGGNPGGVVDDPIGSEHVLLLFVLLYGVYIYRKRKKRLNATSA